MRYLGSKENICNVILRKLKHKQAENFNKIVYKMNKA